MSKSTVQVSIAKKIASDLFKTGNELGRKCDRIEFKDAENKGMGGLCYSALVERIRDSLDELAELEDEG